MAKKITATAAARRFSGLLDDVEQHGEEFVIERQGRAVAKMGPVGAVARHFTGRDLRELLQEIGPPDPEFASDVLRARRELNRPLRDPSPSPSTHRNRSI